MKLLTVSQLEKSFAQHRVLQDISFAAFAGAVVALLGSSGSGKSTLLRCINQLEIPEGGTIQMDGATMRFGKNVPKPSHQQVTQWRAKVGMVFQQFNLWAHLTILDNLIIAPMQVLKKPKAEAIAQAEVLLDKVGILAKQHQYPVQLSGGQQQRAAIARALMMQPELMLFDEPTSALDPEMVGEVLNVMRALAADGMTMIVASHEMGFVREVATQIIFLADGKIVEQGPAQLILAQPQTPKLRRFLESVR